MALTLEELDQLGTLESMPQYPLDATWYVDKVCGPWSLDAMDAFGTLDTINLQMDSDAWGPPVFTLTHQQAFPRQGL